MNTTPYYAEKTNEVIKPVARVTVIEQFYHQKLGYDPTQIETRFSAPLSSDEQPYIRHTSVGESWVKLDTGWLHEDVGMIIIANNKPRRQVNPTPEQLAEDAGKVLELGLEVGDGLYSVIEVPLGEGQRLRLVRDEVRRWRVRCRQGQADISIYAYPR